MVYGPGHLRPICCCGVCEHCSEALGTPTIIRIRYVDTVTHNDIDPVCWPLLPEDYCTPYSSTCYNFALYDSAEFCLCDYLKCHEFIGQFEGQSVGQALCCWEFQQLDWCDPNGVWWRKYLEAGGTQAQIDEYLLHCGFWAASGLCNDTRGRLGIKPRVCIGFQDTRYVDGAWRSAWGISCDIEHDIPESASCYGFGSRPNFTTYWELILGYGNYPIPSEPVGWPPDCFGKYYLDYVSFNFSPFNEPSSHNACTPVVRDFEHAVQIEVDFSPSSTFPQTPIEDCQ